MAIAEDTGQDSLLQPTEGLAAVAESLERAKQCLMALQSPDGWWKGDLETNVTMDAEDLMLREFIGVRDEGDTKAAAAWIRSKQRDDGTWANFFGGPGDLSTTVEAYIALRLAGDEPNDAHMKKAAAFVRASGGMERSRVFTRIWLALFGLWPWDELPALPPELIFLPKSVPLNIYEYGCWARQTFVALTVVLAYRPVRPLPFGIEELRSGDTPDKPKVSLRDWKGRFALLDRILHGYENLTRHKIVRRSIREAALCAAEQWIIRRQEADGSWGGIQPPWVYSILALHLRGYPHGHPVLARSFDGIEKFLVRKDGMRWLEACQSPVWDTALAVVALVDAGVARDAEVVVRAAQWLLGEEIRVRGDWAKRRADLEPGGWAFEFANDNYPDVDDTAEVVLALRRVSFGDGSFANDAIERAIKWTEGMASSGGAWGAFDADNVRGLLYELPYSDFGAVIDPPSSDVTAHVIEMLATEESADAERIERGIAWLRSEQEQDGAWYGRWGVNYLYGVGSVVPALIAANVQSDDPAITQAVEFLERHQNADGGWGEDIRSYDDPSLRAKGASTASQTSWALLALVAAGRAKSVAVRHGVAWLVKTQRDDGNWDEPYYTGTGFPGDFYINYHLYRLVFPVMALGRFLAASREDGGIDDVEMPKTRRKSKASAP